jgi:hypothetical protein
MMPDTVQYTVSLQRLHTDRVYQREGGAMTFATWSRSVATAWSGWERIAITMRLLFQRGADLIAVFPRVATICSIPGSNVMKVRFQA